MNSSGRSGLMLYRGAASAFALTVSLSALPGWAAQDQQDQPEPQSATAPQAADDPAPPAAPESQPPAVPDNQPPAYRLPATLTIPARTAVSVRLSQFLSSDQNKPDDAFSAELQQPLVVDGWVVARRGQTVLGRVAVARKAGRVKGVSQLGVELTNLVLVDGQQLPIRTQLEQSSAGTSKGRDATAIGTTTGLGAAIGAAANGGQGAAIGAGAGAAAGIAGVLLTRGRPTIIPPETVLTFQLEAPITFSTVRSRVAFRPVTQQDYDGGGLHRRPQHLATLPYRPRPYWYSPWGYYYPGPLYFGFYDFGGFGRGRFRR